MSWANPALFSPGIPLSCLLKSHASFYKYDTNYTSCFLWNNQGQKVVQQSKEYYLKSYKSSHNPTSAAMLHAFILGSSPFYAAKFISTVRWGGKSLKGLEYRQQLFKLWSVAGQSQMCSNFERIQHDPDHSEGELIKIKILMQAQGRSLRWYVVVKIQ